LHLGLKREQDIDVEANDLVDGVKARTVLFS
jgi:hypothetical protein